MPSSSPLKSLTPDLLTFLKQRCDKYLFAIISANFNSKFCQSVDEFTKFRLAVESLHQDEQQFLQSFRDLMPLTTYDIYEPFVARFFKPHCQDSDVVDLFAPGFPLMIAISSATSGKAPKLIPKYRIPASKSSDDRILLMVSLKYREILNVFHGHQDIVRNITVSPASAGVFRERFGWNIDQDQDRMSDKVPGHTAPCAVALVIHHPSFLLLHALFALVDSSVETIYSVFSTTLLDMFLYMDRDWSILIDAINSGTIPDLEHIDHVRPHLEPFLQANPARAAELRTIGPPFETSGWATHVWPNLKLVIAVVSGAFSTIVPKLKHLFGPDVIIQSPAYGCSEGHIAGMYQPGDLNRFKIAMVDSYTEYLDVTLEEEANKLCAAWELEQGKHYEPVITTCNGLWRYRIGDVLELLGFAPDDGSPVVRFVGRRNGGIRFSGVWMTEAQLLSSISSAMTDTIGHITEFTCFEDTRNLPPTLGFFVELAQAPGTCPQLAKQRLFDVLSIENEKFKQCYDNGLLGMPTIRVVKSGTFAAYRQQRGEASLSSTNQVKVPIVLTNTATQEWIVDRVDFEV